VKRVIIKILKTVIIIAVLFSVLVASMYFFQEKMIFFPDKLSSDYTFNFKGNFEEIFITTKDSVKLNALLFKTESPKGVIFYLHGNGGCLESVGKIAEKYTAMNYDLFLLDYRGYGKSEGKILSEQQFFDDLQQSYDYLKTRYAERRIAILGYSIGSGPAAWLASVNKPKMLILQAPYYSLLDMMHQRYYLAPDRLLKYKFETWKYVKNCKAPVYIFHGNFDNVINYHASLDLERLFKPGDKLIILDRRGHNGFTDNPAYLTELNKMLDGKL